MADFGGKLRQARERRGVSLRQIAGSTKISVAALEALERNDTSKLPGGIFSRAFVRSYAAEVGLDPDETVREFIDLFEQQPAEIDTSRRQPLSDDESQFESEQRMAGVVLRLVLVSVPLIGVILYYTLRSRPAPPGHAAGAQTEVAAPLPQSRPPEPAAQPTGVAAAPAASPSPAPTPGEMTLDLHPSADCWVSVTADGRHVFAKMMQAGEREHVIVRREAVVEVGDAGAFAYSIDGKEGQPLGAAGQVRTLRVGPQTVRQ